MIIQVWVLDALPGSVAEYQGNDFRVRQDHPGDLILSLQKLPGPVGNRADVENYLFRSGFSVEVARWVVTNLRPYGSSR